MYSVDASETLDTLKLTLGMPQKVKADANSCKTELNRDFRLSIDFPLLLMFRKANELRKKRNIFNGRKRVWKADIFDSISTDFAFASDLTCHRHEHRWSITNIQYWSHFQDKCQLHFKQTQKLALLRWYTILQRFEWVNASMMSVMMQLIENYV